MEQLITHINENWKFYSMIMFLLGCLLIFWLSKYFATKDELKSHKNESAKSLADHQLALEMHKEKFTQHQLEHYKLRDTVHAIDSHLKHLPTTKEAQQSREAMARLEGRLEGIEPLFKQILTNQQMLIENELRANSGDKK